MLPKLVILSVFAGTSASVPILYQSNPEGVQALVRSALQQPEPETKPERPLIVVQQVQPASARGPLSSRSVRLEGDDRGHFTADFRLNGRPVSGLVDTGATLVAINRSTARRLGIQVAASDFKYEVKTANGIARAASTMIDTFELGRIAIRDVQALVLEDEALGGTLVGMSFLKRLSGFRVEQGDLVLEQ